MDEAETQIEAPPKKLGRPRIHPVGYKRVRRNRRKEHPKDPTAPRIRSPPGAAPIRRPVGAPVPLEGPTHSYAHMHVDLLQVWIDQAFTDFSGMSHRLMMDSFKTRLRKAVKAYYPDLLQSPVRRMLQSDGALAHLPMQLHSRFERVLLLCDVLETLAFAEGKRGETLGSFLPAKR